MGLKDLSVLGKKEYRLYLIIIIWFIIDFTIASFNPIVEINVILYIPLIGFCLILFVISFVFRKDLKEELSVKMFLKYALISGIFILIFIGIAVYLIFLILIISIMTYIFITSLFIMLNCYKKGVEFDEKLYKWPFPFNSIARLSVLLGGLFLSAILMLLFAGIGTVWALKSENIANFMAFIPWIMIILMIVLLGISALYLLLGRFNAWLGVFYFWVGIYAIYLMIKAFTKAGGGSTGGTYGLPLPLQIALYVFDLYLVLGTIGSLIAKSEPITNAMKKIPLLKGLKSDSVILWLIFSKVAYEFANSLPNMGVSELKAVAMFILYVPLFFILGFIGIVRYGKLKKEWKKQKKEAKLKKKIAKGKAKPEELAELQRGQIVEGAVYCSKCGTPNDEKNNFCRKCGAPLQK
ncbi:MAG: zinc ribbon domain-containing protein [Promethearchaeia archaeon]